MPPGHTSPPTPGNALMGADLRKTAMLDFPLEGHIEALSQATMASSLMNRSTDTMVSGVKNEAEAEETVRRADPPAHLQTPPPAHPRAVRKGLPGVGQVVWGAIVAISYAYCGC